MEPMLLLVRCTSNDTCLAVGSVPRIYSYYLSIRPPEWVSVLDYSNSQNRIGLFSTKLIILRKYRVQGAQNHA